MRPSLSAIYKWHELFPAYDIALEFAQARRVGRKGKRQIEKQCPRWVESIRFWRGTYRLIAPCGAVFVVARDEYIVDVFPLEDAWRFVGHMQRGRTQYLAASAAKEQE